MPSNYNDDETDRSPTELAGLSALGVAFVIAGVGLYYGLEIDIPFTDSSGSVDAAAP